MDWFLTNYKSRGGVNSGIFNCRPVRGGRTTSLHGEGRACDFGIRPYRAGYGTKLANAIVNNSKELGVQCVIWNRRIWSSKYPNQWRPYGGENPHIDHLHVELTWASAKRGRKAQRDKWAKVLGGQTSGNTSPRPSTKKPAPTPKTQKPAPGPKTPFPLPDGYYFGPKSGGHKSVSGFYGRRFKGKKDSTWLKAFPDQLTRRSWSIGKGKTWLRHAGNDGRYGPEYQALVRAFQRDQKLRVDGLLGEKTWNAAFHNPIT